MSGTEEWFKQNRDFADQMAPMFGKIRMFQQDAEDNLNSAGGQAYHDEVDAKLMRFEQPCVAAENITSPKFQLFDEIGKDGTTTNLHAETADVNRMAQCIMKGLYASYLKKESVFPAPSKAPYCGGG